MTQLREKIDGYEVSLDTDMNGDGEDSPNRVTGCWIVKDGYSASLACLEDTGKLHDGRWSDELGVPQEVIDKISQWAEDNGY